MAWGCEQLWNKFCNHYATWSIGTPAPKPDSFTLKNAYTMSRNSKAVVSFIVGAAVGVAVGYFLNSDKKDELVGKLKYQADKLKDRFRNKKQQLEDAIENELT